MRRCLLHLKRQNVPKMARFRCADPCVTLAESLRQQLESGSQPVTSTRQPARMSRRSRRRSAFRGPRCGSVFRLNGPPTIWSSARAPGRDRARHQAEALIEIVPGDGRARGSVRAAWPHGAWSRAGGTKYQIFISGLWLPAETGNIDGFTTSIRSP